VRKKSPKGKYSSYNSALNNVTFVERNRNLQKSWQNSSRNRIHLLILNSASFMDRLISVIASVAIIF
jgi:hypothetical protein